jgi:hypothetical protein
MKKLSISLVTILLFGNTGTIAWANQPLVPTLISQQTQTQENYKNQALAILPQIIDAANKEEDEYTKTTLLQSVTRVYIASGEYNRVLPLVNTIKDEQTKSGLLGSIVSQYIEFDQLERATETAKSIINQDDQPWVFSALAEA